MIRRGLNENQILVLFSSVHKQEYYSYARSLGIDYYFEDPYESYQFVEILTKHFPALDKEELKEAREQVKSQDGNIKVDSTSEVNINGFEDVGRFAGVKQIVISTLDAFRIRLSSGNAAEQQLANKLESAMRSIDPAASETESVK